MNIHVFKIIKRQKKFEKCWKKVGKMFDNIRLKCFKMNNKVNNIFSDVTHLQKLQKLQKLNDGKLIKKSGGWMDGWMYGRG